MILTSKPKSKDLKMYGVENIKMNLNLQSIINNFINKLIQKLYLFNPFNIFNPFSIIIKIIKLFKKLTN